MIDLRVITDLDKELIIEIFKNKEVKETYMLPDYSSDEGYINLFENFKKLSNDTRRYVRGIYLQDKLIGFINEVEKNEESIELGYVISPLYKGRGFATRALDLSINYLLSIGYKEIVCGAFETNLASIRVMEKAEMKKMLKTDYIEYRGKMHKCIYYSYHI